MLLGQKPLSLVKIVIITNNKFKLFKNYSINKSVRLGGLSSFYKVKKTKKWLLIILTMAMRFKYSMRESHNSTNIKTIKKK